LPLHEAAGNGEDESVRQLIASGHDVDLRDEERGDSSLHTAIGEGNLSTTRLLLDLGANPNLSDFAGRTPLHTAALQGDSEIIQVLLDGGAEVDSQTDDWSAPLHLAVSERNEGAARRLLRGGASVDVPDKDLLAPLHGAVCRADLLRWSAGLVKIARVGLSLTVTPFLTLSHS
jgi:ankyrin repeat protein